MTTIRLAVVGTGAMAARMMPALAGARARVTAVASHDPERARRFARLFGLASAESDLNAILARNDIDAVYIANAPQHHAKTCIAALEAGKAVLCEKPIGLSEAEALQVAGAARKRGVLCMEGLWTLLLPAYRRFIELSGNGDLGEANSLVADFGYPVGAEAERAAYARARGGALLDRAVYLIALALSVLGPVEQVDAQLDVADAGAEKDAFLQLRHKGGGRSQLAASFGCLLTNTAALACSRGLMRLEAPIIGSEALSITRSRAATISFGHDLRAASFRERLVAGLRKSPQLRRINRAVGKTSLSHLPFGRDQYLPELDHFVALWKSGARESDVVPLELSVRIQRIIGQARASAAAFASERGVGP